MKLLKYLFLLLLLVLLGAAAYVALIDGEFEFEESTEAKAPRDLLFDQVDNLKNWENWLTRETGAVQVSYPEKTKGKDAYVHWKLKNNNTSGELSNISIIQNSMIEQKLTTKGRIGKISYHLLWDFEEENDSSHVRLQVKGKQDFWSKAVSLFKDDPDFIHRLRSKTDQGLHRLKTKILNDMEVYSVNVDGVKNSSSQNYVYISQAAKNDAQSLLSLQKEVLQIIDSSMADHSVRPAGNPILVFNSIDDKNQNVIVSIGYPVDSTNEYEDPKNEILLGSLPEQKLVKASLKGNYKHISELWAAVKDYMNDHGLEQNADQPIFETLKITQSDSRNPADWLTELYFPIKEKETDLRGLDLSEPKE